jgi:hypothetical protein
MSTFPPNRNRDDSLWQPRGWMKRTPDWLREVLSDMTEDYARYDAMAICCLSG